MESTAGRRGCSWVWMSARRACGRPWSTPMAGRSPLASRRSRRPIPGRPGPSSSPPRGGRRPATAVRPAWRSADVAPEQVAGIGLDCTACTVVACDSTGKPLRPALLWMDQRAFREAAEISDTGDPVLRYVSGRVSPEWMLPKALWLKRNEPEIYDEPRGSSNAPTG